MPKPLKPSVFSCKKIDGLSDTDETSSYDKRNNEREQKKIREKKEEGSRKSNERSATMRRRLELLFSAAGWLRYLGDTAHIGT